MKSSDSSARATRSALGVLTARVAGERDQRADLALARRLDLLGQAGDRQLAEAPRRAPRTRTASGRARRPRRCRARPCVRAEPVAAFGNIAPPGRSRLPVSTLSTSTSQLASVPNVCVVVPMRPYDRGRCSSAPAAQLAREAPDRRRRRCRSGRDGLGRERLGQRADLVEPGDVLAGSRVAGPRRRARAPSPQQQRVGAGADEDVLVGLLGGARAARVDDDDLARRARGCARSRPRTSGAVIRLPLDASGLAPSISR